MSTKIQVLVGEAGNRDLIARYLREFERCLKMRDSGYELSPIFVSSPEEFKEALFSSNIFFAIFVHEGFPEFESIAPMSGRYLEDFHGDGKGLQIYCDDKLRKALEPRNTFFKYIM